MEVNPSLLGQYEEKWDELSDYEDPKGWNSKGGNSPAPGGGPDLKELDAFELETPGQVDSTAETQAGSGSGGGSGREFHDIPGLPVFGSSVDSAFGSGASSGGLGSPESPVDAMDVLSTDHGQEALREHLLARLRDIQLLARGVLDPLNAEVDMVSSPKELFAEKALDVSDLARRRMENESKVKTLSDLGITEADFETDFRQVKTKEEVPWFVRLYRYLTCSELGGLKYAEGTNKEPPPPVVLEGNSLMIFGPENCFRRLMHDIAFHWAFEGIIITLILFSCAILAVETPTLDPDSDIGRYVYLANLALTGIFAVESLMKVIALGLWYGEQAYLQTGWNQLDMFIVLLSIVSLAISSSGVKALRSLRALRALRPLRLVSRLKGLKVVVDTIYEVLPQLVNVVFFTLIVWLFFGILGLHAFAGTFASCNDGVSDKITCVGTFMVEQHYPPVERVWATKQFNFDNIGEAVYTLYTVATLDNWALVMWDGIDAAEAGEAPIRDNNLYI